jgi:hypothetical protein
MDEELINQSLNQKKIAFATSEHLEAVLAILKDAAKHDKLIGDTEFETLRNAITFDAQGEMIIQFINQIDYIKSGGLVKIQL